MLFLSVPAFSFTNHSPMKTAIAVMLAARGSHLSSAKMSHRAVATKAAMSRMSKAIFQRFGMALWGSRYCGKFAIVSVAWFTNFGEMRVFFGDEVLGVLSLTSKPNAQGCDDLLALVPGFALPMENRFVGGGLEVACFQAEVAGFDGAEFDPGRCAPQVQPH